MANNKKLKKIKKLFDIKSELLISETYCEFWATILNSSFCAFSFLKKNKFRRFYFICRIFYFNRKNIFFISSSKST